MNVFIIACFFAVAQASVHSELHAALGAHHSISRKVRALAAAGPATLQADVSSTPVYFNGSGVPFALVREWNLTCSGIVTKTSALPYNEFSVAVNGLSASVSRGWDIDIDTTHELARASARTYS